MLFSLLYESPATIRRICYNPTKGTLLFEQKKAKHMQFVCYRIATREVEPIFYLSNYNTWETVASDFYGDSLLLVHYLDEKNATQMALELYDTKQQKTCIYLEGLQIESYTTSTIYASSLLAMQKTYYAIARQTGEITTIQPSDIPTIKSHLGLQVSMYYKEGSTHFEHCAEFVYQRVGKRLELALHYLDYDKFLIIEGKVMAEEKPILWIFDRNGNLLKTIQTPQQKQFQKVDSFFAIEKQLFKLDDNKRLLGFELDSE
ncbi:MAG: hypothetical protein JJT94_01695 [Bernardetiaceae bacterium]|nr:hypothetical protein [Bernardetiaceae bacterium]